MLDISSHLRQSLSNVTIDGKVGRQMSQALELAREYKSFNQPNKAVIIELENQWLLYKQPNRTTASIFLKSSYLSCQYTGSPPMGKQGK